MHRHQRGDVLLEALVGVLITALLGAAMAHVAGRVAAGQHEARVANLSVEQLRHTLQMEGVALCDAGGTTIVAPWTAQGKQPVSVQCAPGAAVSLGFGGGANATVTAPREVALRVPVQALEGTASQAPDAATLVVGTRQVAR
ncbi:hypothetical protein [Luteimonas sp. YGD11-2]|uniref:hypothetical protein n=1 Tax=Luteimonas sp. YGD11-2 TaxID=2508168 RepID=UPI00100A9DD9|nr:hypothetical protein [Luteimonas sp. YGD11-2]